MVIVVDGDMQAGDPIHGCMQGVDDAAHLGDAGCQLVLCGRCFKAWNRREMDFDETQRRAMIVVACHSNSRMIEKKLDLLLTSCQER